MRWNLWKVPLSSMAAHSGEHHDVVSPPGEQ
jgi:hypothetical protein